MTKSRVPWNKGLSATEDERVQTYCDKSKVTCDNPDIKRRQTSYKRSGPIETLFELSSRTVSKILRRLMVGCSVCGWNEAPCDIHHIVPKKKGGTNNHDNLTIVCPNCHRLLHSGVDLPVITLMKHVGDTWKEHYYASSDK